MRFFLRENRRKKFGGRNDQTAIKTYNECSVYTTEGDLPSSAELPLKKELFQRFTFKTLPTDTMHQNVKY